MVHFDLLCSDALTLGAGTLAGFALPVLSVFWPIITACVAAKHGKISVNGDAFLSTGPSIEGHPGPFEIHAMAKHIKSWCEGLFFVRPDVQTISVTLKYVNDGNDLKLPPHNEEVFLKAGFRWFQLRQERHGRFLILHLSR